MGYGLQVLLLDDFVCVGKSGVLEHFSDRVDGVDGCEPVLFQGYDARLDEAGHDLHDPAPHVAQLLGSGCRCRARCYGPFVFHLFDSVWGQRVLEACDILCFLFELAVVLESHIDEGFEAGIVEDGIEELDSGIGRHLSLVDFKGGRLAFGHLIPGHDVVGPGYFPNNPLGRRKDLLQDRYIGNLDWELLDGCRAFDWNLHPRAHIGLGHLLDPSVGYNGQEDRICHPGQHPGEFVE